MFALFIEDPSLSIPSANYYSNSAISFILSLSIIYLLKKTLKLIFIELLR